MKRKNKFTAILSLAMMLVLTLTMAFSPVEAQAATAKPAITASQTVVSKGATTQLKATYSKKNVTTSVTWKSSNKKVATVSKKGVLTAKSAGTTYVTVKYKGKTSSKVKITVAQTSLNKSSVKLAGSKTYRLTAKYNGKSVKPSYKSSNTKVATVDKNGNIKALKKGSATITATYKGSKTTCKVTVTSNAHTHKYTATVTRKATCTKEGVTTYKCSCGASYTKKIAKVSHKFNNKVTVEPTATTDGVMTYTCNNCGYSYTELIPALNEDGGGDTDNTPVVPDTPSESEKPVITPEPEQPTECEHNWVEKVIDTIHHDEEGHYETVTVTPASKTPIYDDVTYCNDCGKAFTGSNQVEDAALHGMFYCDGPTGGYHTESNIVGYNEVPAVTEQKWIVDKASYDETIKETVCSICGEKSN